MIIGAYIVSGKSPQGPLDLFYYLTIFAHNGVPTNTCRDDSSPRGTSGDMDRVTREERGVALVKKFRYCRANVNVTASCISTVTASSALSVVADCASLMFPENEIFLVAFVEFAFLPKPERKFFE